VNDKVYSDLLSTLYECIIITLDGYNKSTD